MKSYAIVLLIAGIMVSAAPKFVRAQEEGGAQLTKHEKAELFRRGAQLWPVYCAQCHNPRPPGDYAAYQWDVIIPHMRTLGNIPAADSNAILEYLKDSR
jgi:mono/diheme cytochrome c family protein